MFVGDDRFSKISHWMPLARAANGFVVDANVRTFAHRLL